MILVACCVVWQVVWMLVRVPVVRTAPPVIKTVPRERVRTWYA